MTLYRHSINLLSSNVTEITVGETTASFHTRNTAETFEIRKPGQAEIPLIKQILEHLSPGDVFYDVGANVGLYSIVVAKSISDSEVHAFEPFPENANRLEENRELNDVDLSIHEIAVGSEKKDVHIAEPDDLSHGTASVVTNNSLNSVSVQQQSLDNLVADGFPTPDVVKVDVEGYEQEVVDGMTGLLDGSHPKLIFIEIHDGVNIDRLNEDIQSNGYVTKIIEERPGEQHLLCILE